MIHTAPARNLWAAAWGCGGRAIQRPAHFRSITAAPRLQAESAATFVRELDITIVGCVSCKASCDQFEHVQRIGFHCSSVVAARCELAEHPNQRVAVFLWLHDTTPD